MICSVFFFVNHVLGCIHIGKIHSTVIQIRYFIAVEGTHGWEISLVKSESKDV